jgi:predicted transcriptional regulator
MQGPILAALDGEPALNVTAICKKLGRSTDDSGIRYCLKMLTAAAMIERASTQTTRGMTYVYRRKHDAA